MSKGQMEYAGLKAKSVRDLVRTSAPIRHAGGAYPPKELHEIVAGILTTRSSWVDPIVSNVVNHIRNRERNERIDFVCSISNNTFVIDNNVFVNEYDEKSNPDIKFCEKKESLVFLLLNLLKRLQDIGTVPAINFSSYSKVIEGKIYKET